MTVKVAVYDSLGKKSWIICAYFYVELNVLVTKDVRIKFKYQHKGDLQAWQIAPHTE